jgi:bis(5'-nucleosyl)-tetraphosphatase (symmetrical)
MRICRADGGVADEFSGPLEEVPAGCWAWFDYPGRQVPGVTVVCGHWAALGLLLRPGLMALDSGCVWGGMLTAVRLDDGRVFQEPSAD